MLLEKATLGQDSGDIYVPQFTGPGMLAASQDAAEKKLLGVASPSEYRGLVLGFQAQMMVGAEMTLTWDSAVLQQAPPSTVRLASLTTVTSATMPKADPAILAKIQKTMDDGEPLGLPGNLVALVVEAAQGHDIDALLKLCQSCNDPGYKAKFVAEMTRSAIPCSSGWFDELAHALMTHPAVANYNSMGSSTLVTTRPGTIRGAPTTPTGRSPRSMPPTRPSTPSGTWTGTSASRPRSCWWTTVRTRARRGWGSTGFSEPPAPLDRGRPRSGHSGRSAVFK